MSNILEDHRERKKRLWGPPTGYEEQHAKTLLGDEFDRDRYSDCMRPRDTLSASKKRVIAESSMAKTWQDLHEIFSRSFENTTSNLDSVVSVLLSLQPRLLPRALIGGKLHVFQTHEHKFKALVGEWHRKRAGSSIEQLIDDSYGQIVAMGEQAIPFLLKELETNGGHWATALKWLTGVSVVTTQMRGNMRAIRDAWLKWGTKNGYLEANR